MIGKICIGSRKKLFLTEKTIGNLYPAEIYSRTASNGEQFSKSQIKGALGPSPLEVGRG